MEAGRCYHIFNHANGNDDLFIEADNYRWFLQQYNRYVTPIAETYAYCLMPNHFHFLVQLKTGSDLLRAFPKFETLEKLENAHVLSKQFSNLFSSYTQAFNKKYQRKGSLFLKNFKRNLIDTDHYFDRIIAYIHLNPVSHGFTKSPADWSWSSYNIILNDNKTSLKREAVIKWFGNRDRFMEYHLQYNQADFREIQALDQWFRK